MTAHLSISFKVVRMCRTVPLLSLERSSFRRKARMSAGSSSASVLVPSSLMTWFSRDLYPSRDEASSR